MYTLMNYKFMMYLGSWNDIWALYGNVYGHPRYSNGTMIMVSCPVEFREDKMVITTKSGSMYKLENCDTDEERVKQEIRDCIKHGGYSVH